ncbi:MAG TPA: hypothetical protein VGA56_06190 [Opitutaceae bacterium]
MNTLRLLPRLSLICGLALLAFSTTTNAQDPQEEENLGEFFDRVPIPEGMSKEEIQGMCAMVLATREWTVQKKTDRRVVGYIQHGGAEATVTMRFGGEAVEIFCEGWDLNRAGERVKPFVPKRWLAYLRKDLLNRLKEFSTTR